jgi:hypothetical protein
VAVAAAAAVTEAATAVAAAADVAAAGNVLIKNVKTFFLCIKNPARCAGFFLFCKIEFIMKMVGVQNFEPLPLYDMIG